MSELEQIHNILQAILSNSQQNRKEQELILQEYSTNHPDTYVFMLMQIILESTVESVKILGSIMLRKCLSGFGPSNQINLWVKLQPETKQKFKKEVFQLMLNEKSSSVRNQLCDAIGEIAASAMCSSDQPVNPTTGEKINEWPDIGANIYELYLSRNPALILQSLKIFESLLTYASDFFMNQKNELYALLKDCMENYTKEIGAQAIQALRAVITTSEPEDCTFFIDLHQVSLRVLQNMFNQDEDLALDILDAYCDIADSEPKFFRKYFVDMIQLFADNFNRKYEDEGIKDKIVELIVLICERVPSLLKKSSQSLEKLIEMIFIQIITSCEEIDKKWESPPDGFNEKLVEDSEFSCVKFSMEQINRLISSHEDNVILTHLSLAVQKLLSSTDWRYIFTSLMALSQVGEYVQDIQEVKMVVNVAIKNLASPHPKIRYSACHLIGQVSEDLNPEIQKNYFEEILKPLIQVVVSDNIPRVICHACAALTNFLEGCTKEQLAPYVDDLIKVLLTTLNNGTAFVQEGVVAAISALATAGTDLLSKYYNELMDYFLNLLVSKTDPKLALLKGELLECITILSHGVGYEQFKPYSEQLIKLMIILSKTVGDGYDPLKPYIITGFQRLCLIMKKNIKPYLNDIIPDLFRIIHKVFEKETEDIDDDNEVKTLVEAELNKGKVNTESNELKIGQAVKDNIGTSEDASLAIAMLGVFIYKLKDDFIMYVNDCMELIIPLLTTTQNDQLREESSRCMAGLVRCVKLSQDQNKDQVLISMTKTFITKTFEAILDESQAEIVITQLNSLEEMINNSTIAWMTDDNLHEFCTNFSVMLEKSNLRKKSLNEGKSLSDVEEDEVKGIDHDIDTEEKLHVQAMSLLGAVTKVHKERMMFMYELLVKNTLEQALAQSNRMKQYGIFIIDDILEHLPSQYFPQNWVEPFFKVLEENALHSVCYVRQAAVYGLGLFTVNHSVYVPSYFARLWAALEKALVVPQGKSKITPYNSCKENVVSVIGKVIKYHEVLFGPSLETILLSWVNYLPLNLDHEEAIISHTFLIDILSTNPTAVFGKNMQNGKKILEIMADIYQTKSSDVELNKKIVLVTKFLIQDQNWNGFINELLTKLHPKQIKILQEIAAAQIQKFQSQAIKNKNQGSKILKKKKIIFRYIENNFYVNQFISANQQNMFIL